MFSLKGRPIFLGSYLSSQRGYVFDFSDKWRWRPSHSVVTSACYLYEETTTTKVRYSSLELGTGSNDSYLSGRTQLPFVNGELTLIQSKSAGRWELENCGDVHRSDWRDRIVRRFSEGYYLLGLKEPWSAIRQLLKRRPVLSRGSLTTSRLLVQKRNVLGLFRADRLVIE